jgi:hypothetical protein
VAHTLPHACGFAHGAPPQRVVSCPARLQLAAQLAHHADRRGRDSCGTRRDMNSQEGLHFVPMRHTATGRQRTSVEPSDRCQMPAVVLTCSAAGADAVSRKQRARSRQSWQAACALRAPSVQLHFFPGSRGFETLQHPACSKRHWVKVELPPVGIASWGPGRRAVTAPQPGVGVGAVRHSRKFAPRPVVSETTSSYRKPQMIIAENMPPNPTSPLLGNSYYHKRCVGVGVP